MSNAMLPVQRAGGWQTVPRGRTINYCWENYDPCSSSRCVGRTIWADRAVSLRN